jgi:hypothetical protein
MDGEIAMADTVTTKYLWPPNFDGNPPEPGQPGWKRVRVQLTGISDGSGESAVKKIDVSDLRRPDGESVVRTVLESLEYDAFGFTSLKLEWDRAPREVMAVLAGNNSAKLDYRKSGGLAEQSDGSDGTGDILLTTAGATSGDSYNIILSLMLL